MKQFNLLVLYALLLVIESSWALDPAPFCKDELKPGESRDYCDGKGANTEVEPCYRLTRDRVDPKKYTILVTINFQFYRSSCPRGNCDVNGGGRRQTFPVQGAKRIKTLDDDYRKSVRECFASANDYLQGPNGIRIELVLGQPGPKQPGPKKNVGAPPVVRVNVMDYKIEREDSGNWSSLEEMDCSTTLHEVGHLLGLVDEYDETEEGYYLTRSGRISSAETDIWESSYNCRTLSPDDSLMSHNMAEDEDSIPKLFYPAHYRELIYRDCPEVNKVYRSCAQNAYRGTMTNRCVAVDPLCEDPDFKWLN